MSRPAKAPWRAVNTTTSSAEVPGGLVSVATWRGRAGSRVSTTATPSFGQKRSFEPDAQSEKPHEPT
jgi:hypothetical protein